MCQILEKDLEFEIDSRDFFADYKAILDSPDKGWSVCRIV